MTETSIVIYVRWKHFFNRSKWFSKICLKYYDKYLQTHFLLAIDCQERLSSEITVSKRALEEIKKTLIFQEDF